MGLTLALVVAGGQACTFLEGADQHISLMVSSIMILMVRIAPWWSIIVRNGPFHNDHAGHGGVDGHSQLVFFQFKRNRVGHIRKLTDLDFKVQPMDAIVTTECREQLVRNGKTKMCWKILAIVFKYLIPLGQTVSKDDTIWSGCGARV